MPDPTTEASAINNLREAARSATALVNVALPGTVVKYDAALQKATIRIVPCFRRKDPSNGNAVECFRSPDIHNVPVAWYQTTGFSFTFPLAVGDTGMLMFMDRSIEEWRDSGKAQTTPEDPRRHSLNDAVFVPSITSFNAPIPSAGIDGTAAVLRAPEIKLGSSLASDFIALASLVTTELDAIWTAFSGHSHTHVAPLHPSGTLLTTGNPVGGPSASVASAKVKSE